MPRPMNYTANSIVYFKGDVNDSIYILNTGAVTLRYNDIETGQEINDLIKTGEFFGVKSALGKYPREETAIVLKDSFMLVFTVPEFEQVVSKNNRIIVKMLRVFSNQLRRIHKQVRNLLSTGAQIDPETGLFKIGEYYFDSKKYPQALYVYQRYLTYYPSGKYAEEATRKIEMADKRSKGMTMAQTAAPTNEVKPRGGEASDMAKEYYNAVSIFSQGKFQEALQEFQKIAEDENNPEYSAKAFFEIGRCLYSLNQNAQCIQHYSKLIQKYPKHPDLVEALYYVGSCNEKEKNVDKAIGFYKKILTMASDDIPAYRKAKKALNALEGKSL